MYLEHFQKHQLNDGDVIVLGTHEIIDEDEMQDGEKDDQRAPAAGAN